MDLEMIILREGRERQTPYYPLYMWDLKYDTRELIYEIETES